MWNDLSERLRGWLRRFKDSPSTRAGLLAGALMGAAGVLAGGVVLQAVVASLVANGLGWWMITQSPRAMRFMRKYGLKIDVIVTVGGLFLPVPGVTGFLVGILLGAGFSVFRMLLCGDQGEEDWGRAPSTSPVYATC